MEEAGQFQLVVRQAPVVLACASGLTLSTNRNHERDGKQIQDECAGQDESFHHVSFFLTKMDQRKLRF